MCDGARDDGGPRRRPPIFVVNSSPDVLELMREVLHGEGYPVTTTTNPSEALGQIAALQPALLIIDLPVGEPAAGELLDQLQTDPGTRRVPVIVTSTDPDLLDQAQAVSAGSDRRRFLAKPFDLDALLADVQALTGSA
jgi:two-component system phosphate regulon response regulator OmpR